MGTFNFKLSPYLHESNVSVDFLYHGSHVLINDNDMASGTFFSIDKDIAMEYGSFIYSIELDDNLATIFKPDILGEHLINCRMIPIYKFNIEEI